MPAQDDDAIVRVGDQGGKICDAMCEGRSQILRKADGSLVTFLSDRLRALSA